jgi:hypothetical protein
MTFDSPLLRQPLCHLNERRPLPKATELLSLHIENLRAAGQRLLPPATLEMVMAHPEFQDGVAVMIEVS